MSLREDIKRIQRHVGARPIDGIVGPITVGRILEALNEADGGEGAPALGEASGMDERSAGHIAELDPAVRADFEDFHRIAQGTAAAMGCDYVIISGYRSWEEQDALYEKGRSEPGSVVTNARAGQSWHNFGIAADFGVFRSGRYLDSENPDLARRVHVACAAHAEACGLAWGGDWESFQDIPHYQAAAFPASPGDGHRETYRREGTLYA